MWQGPTRSRSRYGPATPKPIPSYVADLPDLEACSAFGATAREVLDELEIARAAWLEGARAEGTPIPAPAHRPVIYEAAR